MIRELYKKFLGKYFITLFLGLILLFSYILKLRFAGVITKNFFNFFLEMLSFLPLMFVFVGLVDVWIPKEKIEKHIGKDSGLIGIFWVVILAMFQAGPLYVAFPIAYLLWKKGISIRNIFIYIGAFSSIKVPLLSFEISFLGLKFSLLRTLFTLPVFIIISFIMEAYLRNKNFSVKG